MSAPASDVLREVERELVIASDSGETRSVNDLRERFELGLSDLLEGLGVLREHGKAVEEAPGDWRAPSAGEQGAAEPPRVAVSIPDESEGGGAPVAAPARLRASSDLSPGSWVPMAQPTVRLTRAIADALDADSIGRVVKAAIDSMDDGETFIFEVTP